jgi:hypothetical protein
MIRAHRGDHQPACDLSRLGPEAQYNRRMATAHHVSTSDREAIRLRFFRAYRGDGGCTSVGVKRDRERDGWYLSVGVSGNARRLPREFEGLPVRTYTTPAAVHAVDYGVVQL